MLDQKINNTFRPWFQSDWGLNSQLSAILLNFIISLKFKMFNLKCVAQNYAWGKLGSESLVGRIHQVNQPEEDIEGKPFAEFWMGAHVNGPSKIVIENILFMFVTLDTSHFEIAPLKDFAK